MPFVSLYRQLVRNKIPQLFKALEFRETLSFHLLLFARNLFIDDEATYLALLANQQHENWADIPGLNQGIEKAPLAFSADMLHEIETDNTRASSSIKLMREAQEMIGDKFFYARGLVSHEEFNEARQVIPRAKAEFIRKHARHKEEALELENIWPFG